MTIIKKPQSEQARKNLAAFAYRASLKIAERQQNDETLNQLRRDTNETGIDKR